MKFFKWLFGLFESKKPEVEIPEVKKEDVKDFPKQRIALIVGHGPRGSDEGAISYNGISEFEYNSLVAEMTAAKSKKAVKVFYRSTDGIVAVALKAIEWSPDIVIEMHLNSYNGTAQGCEVLCLDGNSEAGKLGQSFAKSFCEKFKRKLRGDMGVKWIASSYRGGLSLKTLRSIKKSILIESFFCDNPNEWIDQHVFAKHLTEWIDEL